MSVQCDIVPVWYRIRVSSLPQRLHLVAGGDPLQLLVPAASAGATVACCLPRHLVHEVESSK